MTMILLFSSKGSAPSHLLKKELFSKIFNEPRTLN
jgi:hypothetical protein